MIALVLALALSPLEPRPNRCEPQTDPAFVRYVAPERHPAQGPLGLLIRNGPAKEAAPKAQDKPAPSTCALPVAKTGG